MMMMRILYTLLLSSLSLHLDAFQSLSHSARRPNQSPPLFAQQRDVVIVGGGLAGLSAALYLTQLDPSRHVTIIERELYATKDTAVASFAAAGMLAPHSERLPRGHLLDLCVQSQALYRDFCQLVESLAKEPDVAEYLWKEDDNSKNNLDPWSVGYVGAGGFLAPAFAGDSVATWAPPEDSGAIWLDEIKVRELEPNLHPNVVGGWWFPSDASVDARRLTCSLRAACVAAGVQMLSGEITSLDLANGKCNGIWLKNGRYIHTTDVLIANGAWMRNLLPVPIEPHKGQSLSLRMPKDRPPLLRRVLFAQDAYIVPKADGRIVIGATVEAGSYDSQVTPAGMLHILSHALELVPGLKDLPIEETWAGLRPTTPDKGPILGKTMWSNLYIAGGYWRNGVLLAPKTGQLLASLIAGVQMSEGDQQLLDAFAWDRFTTKSGIELAANARYAASMHPIHSRRTGAGVAASVGTELGTYSSARSAADERRRDRAALFESKTDDAFERAAQLGKQDSSAYFLEEKKKESSSSPSPVFYSTTTSHDNDAPEKPTVRYEGSVDAITVGSAESEEEAASKDDDIPAPNGSTPDLNALYDQIRANKEKQKMELDTISQQETRPDPGFRIYYEDDSGTAHEVPPYTSPGQFLESLRQKQQPQKGTFSAASRQPSSSPSYNEQTYDGYTAILQANANLSYAEQRAAMKKARQQNRLEDSIDTSQIGVVDDK